MEWTRLQSAANIAADAEPQEEAPKGTFIVGEVPEGRLRRWFNLWRELDTKLQVATQRAAVDPDSVTDADIELMADRDIIRDLFYHQVASIHHLFDMQIEVGIAKGWKVFIVPIAECEICPGKGDCRKAAEAGYAACKPDRNPTTVVMVIETEKPPPDFTPN